MTHSWEHYLSMPEPPAIPPGYDEDADPDNVLVERCMWHAARMTPAQREELHQMSVDLDRAEKITGTEIGRRKATK